MHCTESPADRYQFIVQSTGKAADATSALLSVVGTGICRHRAGIQTPSHVDGRFDSAVRLVSAIQSAIDNVGEQQCAVRRLASWKVGLDRTIVRPQQWCVGHEHIGEPNVVDLELGAFAIASRKPGSTQAGTRRKLVTSQA